MVSFQDLPFNPASNPIPAQIAQDAFYGEDQEPLGYRLLDNIPNATSVMGWNAWRASNTILGGHTGGGKRIRNHLPGRFSRMSSMDNVTGANGAYTPFDILARLGNWEKGGMPAIERWMDKGFDQLMESDGLKDEARDVAIRRMEARRALRPGEGDTYFASGTYARLSTASRMSGMSGMRADRAIANAGEMINRSNPDLFQRISKAHDLGGANPNITSRQMGDYVTMSSKGTYSNFASGYMRAAMGGADETVRGIAPKAWQRGAARATEHLALGGLKPGDKVTRAAFSVARKQGTRQAAKFGLAAGTKAAGAAIPGVNVAMAAWTAIDLTKMGVELAREIPGFTRDALNSFKGDIQKPIFGTRYVDNEVAATSRQRGVMAIQNSQLNARSVLGNEASGLHAYYS